MVQVGEEVMAVQVREEVMAVQVGEEVMAVQVVEEVRMLPSSFCRKHPHSCGENESQSNLGKRTSLQ